MNLHRLVRGVIPLVNPDQEVVILRSTGYTVDDTGRQMPQYAEQVTVRAQVQPVPETVLQHVEGYNQSSIYRNMYLDGGLDRLAAAPPDRGGIWCTGTALRGWWIRCPRHGIPLPGGR